MTETAQQYTKRILGNLDGQPALSVQQATPQKLAKLMGVNALVHLGDPLFGVGDGLGGRDINFSLQVATGLKLNH
jgi:hypothetical protein